MSADVAVGEGLGTERTGFGVQGPVVMSQSFGCMAKSLGVHGLVFRIKI